MRGVLMVRHALALLALMAASGAAAQPVLYDCDITQRRQGVDWISPKVVVILRDDGTVLVSDSVILWHKEEPIPVRARTRGDRLIVDWTLTGMVDAADLMIPQFSYRATINTKAKTIRIKAKPVGFPQSWTGRGTCKTRNK